MLLANQAGVQALAAPFPDVPADSLHAPAIDYLKTHGIIAGYADGSFKPDNTINRAEALKLVFLGRKALSLPDVASTKTMDFPDVAKTDWFYSYVDSAYNLDMVKGYDDGTFKPANEITAAESLKIIFSGLVADFQSPVVTEDPYTDVKSDQWYAPYVLYGRDKMLIEASSNGTYAPERKMTRAEFAEVIYRVLYMQSNKLDRFPMSLNWPICNNFQWGYRIKLPYSWQVLAAGNQLILWKQDKENGQVSFGRVFPNSAVAIVALDANASGLSLQQYLDQMEYGAGATKQVMTLNSLPYAYVMLEQNGLQDNYFQLAGNKILILYTQFGDGPLSNQLKEELRYIIGSVKESTSDDGVSRNCLPIPKVANPGSTADSTGSTDTSNATGTGTAATTAGTTGTGTSTGTNSGTTATGTSTISDTDQLKADILKLVLVQGKATEALQKLDDEVMFETDSIGIGTGPVDYYYSAKINLTLKIDRNSATILATKTDKTSSF